MIDIMLDIETIGTTPGCVVSQVTLVPFNINSSELSKEAFVFNQTLHVGQQIAMGFEVDFDTLKWWMSQPENIRMDVFCGDIFLDEFCVDYKEYLENIVNLFSSFRIWSTSAKVDFGCIPVLFKRSEIDYPDYHREERCARTFVEMTKLVHPEMKLSKMKTTHYAVDDCNRQIADLQIAYSYHMNKIDKPLKHLTIDELEALKS